MKLPSRNVSIFTLSALDVLAMATGVFVLLLVMLMPYYRKTFDAHASMDAVRAATAVTLAEVQTVELLAAEARNLAGAAAGEAAQLKAQAEAMEEATRQRRRPTPQEPLEQESGRATKNQVVDAIDVVFVIDTTASMTPVIGDLAASLRGIVNILERLVPSVRIGIAAYKDRDTGLAPVVSLPLTSTDPNLPRIINFVEGLRAATVGSRTLEEDLHLGLYTAMNMQLRPSARQVLVVIGDAATHQPYQAETLFRTQRFVGDNELRTVSSLFVTTPSSLSAGQRARPFFQAIAGAGGGSFNDHAGSMIESVLLSVLVDDLDSAETLGR